MTFRDTLRARAAGLRARIVLPEGADPRIRHAADELSRLAIAEPILVGPGLLEPAADPRIGLIGERLRSRRPAAVRDGVHALDLAADPVRFGVGLVAIGEADGCVAGATTPTADVIRATLWLIGLAPGVHSLSAAMYLGLGDRVLTYTDVAVVPQPSAEELAQAARAAATDRRALVGDEPVVAFLSYSTAGSAGGESVELVREAVARFRALAPAVVADGEMQLDAALDPVVAARKCPTSPVAGRANVLIFPSLDAANIAYKLTERLAGATAAGPLLQGPALPISDLSRGAAADDIVDVAAMVALQSAARRV
ncbi:MAG TPA: phosphate acyltransferase [Gemmatimonadales bacterium]